jgi:hypothetical protein
MQKSGVTKQGRLRKIVTNFLLLLVPISVFFRVRPWQCFFFCLFSVFYFCFLPCFSVLIRGKSYAYSSALFPWQCFFFSLPRAFVKFPYAEIHCWL